jgi:hypothetical protein
LDFLVGLMMSEADRSILPKMELALLLPLSAPDIGLVIEVESEFGMNAGASGRNLGPALEKLKSLRPGAKAGVLTLILVAGTLGWLELAGFTPMLNAKGWKALAENLNAPGLKLLVGSNLNSGASTLSFEKDDLLPWPGRGCWAISADLLDSSVQGLLAVENDR